MELIIAIALLVAGFALLVFGGEFLVKASVSVASRWNVSPAVIGATIIAGGTSAPEMVTSALAALRDVPDVATGNVVGSNIFNLLAILGVSCLLKPNKVDNHTLKFDYPILLFATLLFLAAGWDGTFMRVEGFVFLGAMVVFLALAFLVGKGSGEDDDEIDRLKSPLHDVGFLALGFVGLIGGADLALRGGVMIGELAGLSERVIGITIISVGTGLPELATSMVAAMKGRSDLAIANVIGSNVLNTFGVVGIAASMKTLVTSIEIVQTDAVLMAFATALLLIPMLMPSRTLGKKVGMFFLFSYVGYVTFLLI